MKRGVKLRLTSDEALVLFEWLHRMEDEDAVNVPIVDQGELAALWCLSGALEKTLVEPFHPDYAQMVVAARERLRRRYFGEEAQS